MRDAVDELMATHFAEVGLKKLPSAKEEIESFTKYRLALTQEQLAKLGTARTEAGKRRRQLGKEIACGYLRFVIQQACKRTRDPQLMKDLIGQGYIGLMIGVQKFDPTRGTKFLTYAANWINVYMQDYLDKLGTVHVPSQARKELRKQKNYEDRQIANGEIERHTKDDITTTPIDTVAIAADHDTEHEMIKAQSRMLDYMEQADLSLSERIALIYRFGLRGVEMEIDALAQLFYELDGVVFLPEDLLKLQMEGLEKLRSLLVIKEVSMTDLLP